MEQQVKSGQVMGRDNTSIGDIIVFRGKRFEVVEIVAVGVWLKPKRHEDKRDFIYFHEAEKFNIVFA